MSFIFFRYLNYIPFTASNTCNFATSAATQNTCIQNKLNTQQHVLLYKTEYTLVKREFMF